MADYKPYHTLLTSQVQTKQVLRIKVRKKSDSRSTCFDLAKIFSTEKSCKKPDKADTTGSDIWEVSSRRQLKADNPMLLSKILS